MTDKPHVRWSRRPEGGVSLWWQQGWEAYSLIVPQYGSLRQEHVEDRMYREIRARTV